MRQCIRFPFIDPARRRLLATALLLSLCGFEIAAAEPSSSAQPEDTAALQLLLRERVERGDSYRIHTRQKTWNPKETAIVVCDMWNLHHSQNATRRTAELAPRMNEVLKAARAQGVLIVHAPSNCMEFYQNHPARKRTLAIPRAAMLPREINQWCRWLTEEEQDTYPFDQSDGGADDDRKEAGKWYNHLKQQGLDPGRPWTRQIDSITIDGARDLITDSGIEHWSLQEYYGIKNVILMGVHTNMCVLGRPFGLRQMAKNGRNVVLMRDMTDTMYSPKARPFVSHFTGTDLIVEHIEKFVCPTITSGQILRDGKEFRFKSDRRKHLVIIAAEVEYNTAATLQEFALKNLGRDFRVSYVNDDPSNKHVLHGLGALKTADVVLISVRRRGFPKAQLDEIRKFVAAGGPVVGIRTASHGFAPREATPQGHQSWPEFDRDILGGNYRGHFGNKAEEGPATIVQMDDDAATHPIMQGFPTQEFKVRSWLYKTSPLGPRANLLLTGRVEGVDGHEPVAWTNTTAYDGNVFYTSLGHPKDFELPAFRRLLRRGIYWAAGRLTAELESTGSSTSKKVDKGVGSAVEPTATHDNTHRSTPDPGFDLRPSRGEPSLKIPADMELDLLLREPVVANPLYINFDARGRLWVVQYRQYPWPAGLKLVSRDAVWRNVYDPPHAPPPPHAANSPFRGKDRITIHEDTDGDGEFDEHKVFVDGLNFCTAALPGRGGVYVLNPPYLLFYSDRNGDDIPDDPSPQVLLSGFGIEDSHSLASNLRWGPDGWIYATQGSTVSGSIVRHGPAGRPVRGEAAVHSMGQNVWRYHPEQRRYEIFAEGGGNAFGVEIDSKGRIYSGHNGGDTRGFHYVQGGYYRKNFGKHGTHSNPYVFTHFPAMRHERVPRFTHTFEIYESTALPDRYHGKLFGLDPHNNYVVHSDISAYGSTRQTNDIAKLIVPGVGERANWFSPVDIQTGPDGALYIADWYSTQTNHYRNHEGQTNPDLGRVFRFRGKDHEFSRGIDLAACSTQELVESYLRHPNRWHRETALRLLGDRHDPSVVPLLTDRLRQSRGQNALEYLWALNLCGGFDNALAIEALRHPDRHVRRWAIRLVGDNVTVGDRDTISPKLSQRLVELAQSEPDAETRSQLASTARRLPAESALSIIAALLMRGEDKYDVHIPGLLWWALEAHSGEYNVVLKHITNQSWWESRLRVDAARLPECLIRRWALGGSPRALDACGQLIALAPTEMQSSLTRTFIAAYQGRSIPPLPKSLAESLAQLDGIYGILLGVRRGNEDATRQAFDAIKKRRGTEAELVQLVEAVGEVRALPEESVPLLLSAMKHPSPRIQAASIVALQNFDDDRIAPAIIAAYPRLSAELKVTSQATLASRAPWALTLLEAIDRGEINTSSIEQNTLERLRFHQGRGLQRLLGHHFPEVGDSPAVLNQQVERLATIVRDGKGTPARGQSIFFNKAACGKCHQIYGRGGDIGPDLTAYNRSNLERMLLSVVHPSAEIREGYEAYNVVTADGQVLSGFKIAEDDTMLILRGIDGQNRTVRKADIDEIVVTPRSLMPEGLLNPLSDQELRDLFAFLSSTTPPR